MLNLASIIKQEYDRWKNAKDEFCYEPKCETRLNAKLSKLLELKRRVPDAIQNIVWGRLCLHTNLDKQHVFIARMLSSKLVHLALVTRDIVRGSRLYLEYANATDIYRFKFQYSGEYLAASLSIPHFVHTSVLATPMTEWKIEPKNRESINDFYLKNNHVSQYLYVTNEQIGQDNLLSVRLALGDIFQFENCDN